MKKSNSQEKVQTFMLPQKKPPCVYSIFFCVCTRDVIFLDDHLETKHLVIMGLKRTSSSPRRLDLMTVWTNRGQMCWKVQKSTEIHKQFGVAARTYAPPPPPLPPLRKPSFMHVVLGRPPSLPPSLPSSARLIDGAGDSCTSQCHTARYLATFITLSFWIIGSDGLARMNDTFRRVAQLQPGSSVSWQAPLHATPDRRGLAKCLAKGLH